MAGFRRLPSSVVPRSYDLRLHPDLTHLTFSGHENVNVEVREEVREVKMNSADIAITSATFQCAKGELVGKTEYNVEEETVVITFSDVLPVGSGKLSLDFNGELNDKLKGFYRSKYTHPNGEQRYAAVTKFEPTDCRRAFPCWDEPSVKATFDITLVAPKDRVALSNMPVIEEKDHESDPSLKVVRFGRSPIMSTYLVAFIVGEYDYIEDRSPDGVLVRVYTPLGKQEQGRFAMEVALKTLPFYKEYFGIAYPLPKLDLIAISEFSSGAMENWGLITYRETALLFDTKNSSSGNKQWVALVVGHELAHMWFGNLVTMEWWTHLWLNEGFASFIEYLCVDHCFPEYNIWNQFVAHDLNCALELDALKNSHPIEVPVGHPSEIKEIFDAISYCKGASIIRMLNDWMGDEDFRKGLNRYLNKFLYGNATTDDLWECLESVSGKPVSTVMNTWTKQMGFPVLKITERKEGSKRFLDFSQMKFCADGTCPPSDGAPLWLVPIALSYGSNPTDVAVKLLMDKPTITVEVKLDEPVKINPGQIGVYRVHYSSGMLNHLLPGVKSKTLPPRDRLGLSSDLFALCRAGVASTVDYLRLVEAFVDEEDYIVWVDIVGNLRTLAVLLSHTDYEDEFKAFNRRLFHKLGKSVGWDARETDGHSDSLLRSLVVGHLGRCDHEETVAESHKKLEAHASGKQPLIADLRAAVYRTTLMSGDEKVYETMLTLFRSADLHEEKMRVARTLGSACAPALIERTLKFAMSDEIRSQDTPFVITSCLASKVGRDMTWKFVRDNWDTLHENFKGGHLLRRLVKATCEDFASEERAQEIEAFFSANPTPAAARSIEQAVENVRLNASWLSRDSVAIKSWLEENKTK